MLSPTERNQPDYQLSAIQTPADVSDSVCQSVADIHIHKAYNAKNINSPEGKQLIKRKVDRHLTQQKRARSDLLEPELKEAFLELAKHGRLGVNKQLKKYGLKHFPAHETHRSEATNEQEFLNWIERQNAIDGLWFTPSYGFDKRSMTPAILSAATSKLSSNFCYFLSGVPEELKTDDFLQALLQSIQRRVEKRGTCYLSLPSLSAFPEQFIDSKIASLFVSVNSMNLQYVPDSLKTKELCLKAFLDMGRTIAYVPKAMITDDFLQRPYGLSLYELKHLPEEMITEDRLKKIHAPLVRMFRNTDFSHCSGSDLFEKMLQCDERFLCYLPSTVLKRFPERLLSYIERNNVYIEFQGVSFPDPQQTLEKLVLIHSGYHTLVEDYKHDQNINKEKIYALCFSGVHSGQFNMNNIPVEYHTHRLCYEIMERFQREPLPLSTVSFLMRFPEGTTFVRQKLDEHAMNGLHELQRLTESESIPLDEKIALIDRFDRGDLFSSYFQQKQYESLYSVESPATFTIDNPFLGGLKQTVYGNQFNFCLNPASEEIQQYLAGSIPCSFSDSTGEIKVILKNLENESICGGRTFKGFYMGQCYYFKIQRKEESLETLAREGLMHRLCHSQVEGVSLLLKSEVPEFVSWFQIKQSELPALHNGFADELEIDSSGDNPRVNVYCYRASPEYSHYAHTPIDKDDLKVSLERSEEGFLKAAWDIGKLCSVGLIPTSTLPAFHDTGSKRRWLALAALLSGHTDRGIPGCFGAWKTTATDKPDFGVTGLRDIGDTEGYGRIHSYFNYRDAEKQLRPNTVNQRIALCNSITENLLAMVLVRARLRQHCKGYHYRNPEAIKATMDFIQNSAEQLLKGLFDQGDHPATDLQSVLKISTDHYQNWLRRSAREILYWTALQPGEQGFIALARVPKSRVSLSTALDRYKGCLGSRGLSSHSSEAKDSNFTPYDCYSVHVNDTRRFCPELYPSMAETSNVTFPDDFININDKLNLGLGNNSFPLVSLMKGYTLLCDRVFSKDNSGLLKEERLPLETYDRFQSVASPMMTVAP